MSALAVVVMLAAAVPPRPDDGAIRVPLPVEYVALRVEPGFDVKALPVADQPAAASLADLVSGGGAVRDPDLAAAELLFSRHRRAAAAWRLLRAVHVRAAEQARAGYRLPAALVSLRRLATVAPEPEVVSNIVVTLLELGRWPEAEDEAQSLVAQRPDDVGGHLSLAFARLRQDRAACAGGSAPSKTRRASARCWP